MQTWAQVLTRVRGEDVSFTDVKIKIPEKGCDQGMWMTSCTGSVRGGFWEIWKSQELSLAVRRRRVTFASSQWPCGGCHTYWGGGGDGKVSIEILCLSPYVETFNSKVIKGFVPELRNRKCFSCFGIPMFYVYMLWIFYVRFTYPYLAMVHDEHGGNLLFLVIGN